MKIVSGSIFYVNADQLCETSSWNFADKVNNLLINGDAEFGSLYNMVYGGYQYSGVVGGGLQNSGSYCFYASGSVYALSNKLIPVNTADTYFISACMKSMNSAALSLNYSGFACYDKYGNYISLSQLGGAGNTTTANATVNGATAITISSAAGWAATGDPSYLRYALLYPPTDPDYYVPYRYSRIQLAYSALSGNSITLSTPWAGATIPAGTPISNGRDGSTYNYALTSNNVPAVWTKYTVSNITGETGTSNAPYEFRYGTAFIRWMHLNNLSQASTYVTLTDDIVIGNLTNKSQCLVYNKNVSLSKVGVLMTSDLNEMGF
jgi:hypothetical protein